MKQLSVVTAVHNQIEYSRLFLESLEKYTAGPYDLIVVDNASHDGSAELFAAHGALVLKNRTNACYACSQNQGLSHVKTPYVAFLNNDVCLSARWDERLIGYMELYGLDVISPCGIETMESDAKTREYMRRWRRINALQRLRVATGVHYSARHLAALVSFMYGGWEAFTQRRTRQFAHFLYPGISGNALVARRTLFDTIGPWNTLVGASDWDLRLRLVKRQTERGDVKQPMVAGDVFVHHFIRATFRAVKQQRGCGHEPAEITEAYEGLDLAYLRMPSLSLIIAVHDKPDFLEKIFTSLLNQTFLDFEVVVSDDGSGPAIASCVAQWQGRFRYPIAHVRQEHKGFRKTIIANRAVAQSRSGYLCFIDGDSVLHHAFLATHFKNRQVHTVLSGRRVMLSRELTEKLTIDDIKSGTIEKLSFLRRGHLEDSLKYGLALPYASRVENMFKKEYWILGSNFSVHKGDYYSVNGYDETLTGRGLEDNNLCARFKKKGLRIKTITREAIQYHLHHESDPIPHTKELIRRYGHPEYFWAPKGIVG
jgi:GT2 family glycosyltransferase